MSAAVLGMFVQREDGRGLRVMFNLGTDEYLRRATLGPNGFVKASIQAAADMLAKEVDKTGLFTDG